jgi:hypothetical protein
MKLSNGRMVRHCHCGVVHGSESSFLTLETFICCPLAPGRIEVHSPHKLESLVLQKYFRHSKFASFQRQLNYFGFRKLAGKGKMAPCSYVNEAATQDIGSLLLIKVLSRRAGLVIAR